MNILNYQFFGLIDFSKQSIRKVDKGLTNFLDYIIKLNI